MVSARSMSWASLAIQSQLNGVSFGTEIFGAAINVSSQLKVKGQIQIHSLVFN